MKTVMVTGSAGYIGSNLCKVLVQEGYNIIQVDKAFGDDIMNTDLHQYHNVGYVVHLAAISSIGECQENKQQAIKDNVLATTKISNYAKDYHIPIIFASSQAVKTPDSSVYAMTKYIGEECFKLSNRYSILRFANVFGGDNFIDEKTSVVAKFIRAKKSHQPLIINGTGDQTRDFIHVHDICTAIMKCIDIGSTELTCDVGTGVETSILEVARLFESDITFNDTSGMVGVKSNVANTNSIEKRLGFVPNIKIGDYIESII